MRNRVSEQELQDAASALVQLKKITKKEKKPMCIDLTMDESSSAASANMPTEEPAVKESRPICIDLTLNSSDDEEFNYIKDSSPSLFRDSGTNTGTKESGAAAIDIKSASEPDDLSDKVSIYEDSDSGSASNILTHPKLENPNLKRPYGDISTDSAPPLGTKRPILLPKKPRVKLSISNNSLDGAGSAAETKFTNIDNLQTHNTYSLDSDSMSMSSFADSEDIVVVGKEGIAAAAHLPSLTRRKDQSERQFSNLCDDIRQAEVNSMSKYHSVYLAASDIIANKGNLDVLKPGCTPKVLKALKHVLSQDIVAEEKANSSLNVSSAGPAVVSSAQHDAGVKGLVKVREQAGAHTSVFGEYTDSAVAAYPKGVHFDSELVVIDDICFFSSSFK